MTPGQSNQELPDSEPVLRASDGNPELARDRGRGNPRAAVFSLAQIRHLMRVEFARADRYGYELSVLAWTIGRSCAAGVAMSSPRKPLTQWSNCCWVPRGPAITSAAWWMIASWPCCPTPARKALSFWPSVGVAAPANGRLGEGSIG